MGSGFDYADTFTTLTNAVALTQGGTIVDTSAAVDLDGKASMAVSVEAVYSDHAKAGAGLSVSVLRNIDNTNYEDNNSGALNFEMPFVQNTTVRKGFAISVGDFDKIKIRLDWGNTTSSSSVTVTVRYKLSDIV